MSLKWISAAAAALAAMAMTSAPAFAGEVRVMLTNVEARGGRLLVSLQTEAQFMQPTSTHSQVVENPAAGTVTVVFPNVTPGAYALLAMHDEDGDYQMRMSEGGAPLEGWAISNGAALAGPPSFASNHVTVGPNGLAMREPMNYAAGSPR